MSKLKNKKYDLFIFAGELSGDLHGASLLKELKKQRPKLKICAVAGPKMRKEDIDLLLPTEKFLVLGFIDVVLNFPKLFYYFLKIKKFILTCQPKAVLFIDYPGFSIAMEKALRKKNFKGKLIHYICPTVWAWKKKRIFTLNRVLDLLLCILPFEPKCFANLPKNTSSVDTHYVGHPLIAQIPSAEKNTPQNIIGLFPGSRIHAIKRNLPIQIKAVEQFMEKDENLKCGISLSHPKFVPLIKEMTKQKKNFFFFSQEDNYQMMKKLKLAIATSGTITLELALHNVPTVVTYAIKPLDLFIARKIFKINLPYYCLVNIIANKEIFKEAYGPNLTPENLLHHIETFLNEKEREKCIEECKNIRKILGEKNAAKEATKLILKCIF